MKKKQKEDVLLGVFITGVATCTGIRKKNAKHGMWAEQRSTGLECTKGND